jgi:hypothetical protein
MPVRAIRPEKTAARDGAAAHKCVPTRQLLLGSAEHAQWASLGGPIAPRHCQAAAPFVPQRAPRGGRNIHSHTNHKMVGKWEGTQLGKRKVGAHGRILRGQAALTYPCRR